MQTQTVLEKQTVKRPAIPAEWYKPSTLDNIRFLLYISSWYALPGWLCYFIAISMISLPLKILLIVPLTILAGYGVQMMGFIGHEGFHLSLHSNKIVSVLIGLFFASSVITYFDMGAMMRHWSHHRFTNQPSDPDIQILQPVQTWWQRLFFARLVLNYHHFRTTLNTALNRPYPFPYMMPFELTTVRKLCRLNFVFSLFWFGVYLGIYLYDPIAFLFVVALPMIVLMPISGCQPYIDHGDTQGNLFNSAWSRTSPFMTMLFVGANYHLEHHLYPGVPCYRLHKVHKFLKENKIYEQTQAKIEPSFFSAYRHLASDYSAGNEDSSFDPFKLATNSGVSNI